MNIVHLQGPLGARPECPPRAGPRKERSGGREASIPKALQIGKRGNAAILFCTPPQKRCDFPRFLCDFLRNFNPRRLKPAILKPVSRVSIQGNLGWSRGCFLGQPFCTSKQGVWGSWLGIARKCLDIPRTEKWHKTGHADDWVYSLISFVFFGKRQGKPPKSKDFPSLLNPYKTLAKKKEKTLKKAMNSSKSKKIKEIQIARKRRSGFIATGFRCGPFKQQNL